jgi:hypothetical protein
MSIWRTFKPPRTRHIAVFALGGWYLMMAAGCDQTVTLNSTMELMVEGVVWGGLIPKGA